MKYKMIFSLLILLVLVSCSKSNDVDIQTTLTNSLKNIDIWNSIQYEVISDINSIRAIEPKATEGVVLINIFIRLENRGSQPAQDFKVKFIGEKPMSHIDGSLKQGVDSQRLEVDKVYELLGHFTFGNVEDLNQFIENSSLLIEWEEDNINKKMELRLPVEPTHVVNDVTQHGH